MKNNRKITTREDAWFATEWKQIVHHVRKMRQRRTYFVRPLPCRDGCIATKEIKAQKVVGSFGECFDVAMNLCHDSGHDVEILTGNGRYMHWVPA